MLKVRKKINIDWCLCGTSLFVELCVLLFVKMFLVYDIYENLSPFSYCIKYFISDVYFFVVIAFLLMVIFYVKKNIIKIICDVVLLFFSFLYCIDIFIMKYFLKRETILSIFEMLRYGGNGGDPIIKVVVIWIVLYISVFLIFYIILKYKNFYKKFSTVFSTKSFLIIYLVGVLFYLIQSFMVRPYLIEVKNILSLNLKSSYELYEKDLLLVDNYETYTQYKQGNGQKVNIIFLFGESFSAIDSMLLGGNDNMPYFDEIQKNGIRFINFFANGETSIKSHVSVFQGLPILGRDAYLHYDCLPEFLNELGYKTTYISTSNLDFLNEREYLEQCGFQKIIGEEEFLDKQHFVRDAAPDEDLYDRALTEIMVQSGNFFIGMANESFHAPYSCPYGKEQSLCLKYADEKLYDFYNDLKNIGFFDSGILIIVGDHRKREPIQSGEYAIFGPSWGYRSVATILGYGITSGLVNDNLIQPTDFYYSIKKRLGSGEVSLDLFYNDVFDFVGQRNWGLTSEGKFIYSEGGGYSLQDIGYKKETHKDIYDYYLSIKKLWLYRSKLGNQEKIKDS